jgi:hypothetical protein
MRYLDPASENFERIDRALKARQLKPVNRSVWEIHGPHLPDMDFEVYVGEVVDAQGRGPFIVVIHPRAVYEVASPSAWWNTRPTDRIPTTSSANTGSEGD